MSLSKKPGKRAKQLEKKKAYWMQQGLQQKNKKDSKIKKE